MMNLCICTIFLLTEPFLKALVRACGDADADAGGPRAL